MPETISSLALRDSGGLVAAMRSGFCFVDLDRAEVHEIADPERHLPGNRFNDGKCDARGRFWAGTMQDAEQEACGALYRLDPDLSVHEMDDGYGITNGPAWSPDGTVFYHNDSTARAVYAFDCDQDAGTIRDKRVFVRLTEHDGFPDGQTVDSAGCLWLAHWGGWRVTRFTPAGVVDRVMGFPVGQVTSCAFGGPDLRTLYVTTASTGLDDRQRAEQPLAGGLFAVEVEVAGVPAARFGG